MPKNASQIERFWEKVKKTSGCWIWIGQTHSYGYGRMESYIPKRIVLLAHRLSWEIHFGQIPNGLNVLHRCDNPPCVNPKHLFLGTQKNNIDDMCQKGRNVRGQRFPQAKLSDMDVRSMRLLHSSTKITHEQLGKRFGVSQGVVTDIINRKRWRHI